MSFDAWLIPAMALVAVGAAVWAAVRSYYIMGNRYSHDIAIRFDSGAAVRMNGFIGSHDDIDRLRVEISKFLATAEKAWVIVDKEESELIWLDGPQRQVSDNLIARLLSMMEAPRDGSNRSTAQSNKS